MQVASEGDATPTYSKYHTSLAPEGDIILSLPGPDTSAGRVLYRADKLILSRHSPVFAGLFTIPYDEAVNETFEDLPVVRLGDDCEAMGRLLDYLYNPSCVSHLLFGRGQDSHRNSGLF